MNRRKEEMTLLLFVKKMYISFVESRNFYGEKNANKYKWIFFAVHVSPRLSQKKCLFFLERNLCADSYVKYGDMRVKKKSIVIKRSRESFEEDKGKWAEASGMDLFSVEIEKECIISRDSYLPHFYFRKKIN